MHTISTISVAFDGDYRATARSAFVYWATPRRRRPCARMGRYLDAFRRTEDGWKLRGARSRSADEPRSN